MTPFYQNSLTKTPTRRTAQRSRRKENLMLDPKPCPWCKGNALAGRSSVASACQVVCLTCGAGGPRYWGQEKAIAAWNRVAEIVEKVKGADA